MEFSTPCQKQIYEKITPWMHELFGTFVHMRDDAPAFAVVVGTALAQVFVVPWGEDNASVTIRSYVVTGAEPTSELMHFLLRENDSMRFGAFGLDRDNDIFFEHTIVGSTVDKEELKASVMAVVITADRYDEKITERWGGQRAIDRG